MKTKPAKLLMAMLLGMGSMAVATTSAFADDNSSSNSSKNSSDSKSSAGTPASSQCTDQLVSACGVNVVKTTCSVAPVSSSTKSGESDDSSHKSSDKDSHDNKNDHDRNDDFHKDHRDRSSDSVGNKISICHRMGGAEVSLTVANDGWASGHSKHALDTIGRCSDFDSDKSNDDSKQEKDKSDVEKNHETKSSLSDAGYSMGLTLNQIACLKGSPSSSYTINGTTYPGAGFNSSNVTVSLQGTGASGASSSRSSRGGARTLH